MKNRNLLLFVLLVIVGIGSFGLYRWQHEKTTKEAEEEAREHLLQIAESQTDCHAPCWQGLVPGQSGSDEYQQLVEWLEKSGFTFRSESQGDDYTTYIWVHPEGKTRLFIRLEDRINSITFIRASSDLGSTEILFNILGEPDYYASERIWDIESNIALNLLYLEKGVVISFPGFYLNQVSDNCYLNLSSSQNLNRISLVTPGEPLEMLEDSYSSIYSTEDSIKPWSGIDSIVVNKCFPEPKS